MRGDDDDPHPQAYCLLSGYALVVVEGRTVLWMIVLSEMQVSIHACWVQNTLQMKETDGTLDNKIWSISIIKICSILLLVALCCHGTQGQLITSQPQRFSVKESQTNNFGFDCINVEVIIILMCEHQWFEWLLGHLIGRLLTHLGWLWLVKCGVETWW